MRFGDHIDLALLACEWRPGRGIARTVKLRAGRKTTERVVPPAGEAHSFEVDHYPLTVEVSVSAQGRAVGLWVNGHRIDLADYPVDGPNGAEAAKADRLCWRESHNELAAAAGIDP